MSSDELTIGLLTFLVIVVALFKIWFDHIEAMKKNKSAELDNLCCSFDTKLNKLRSNLSLLEDKIVNQLEDIQDKLEEDKHIYYDDIAQFVDGVSSLQIKPSRYVELLAYEAELFDLKLKLKKATNDENN